MSTTIETSDKTAMAIYRRAFPQTNFRSLTVAVFRGPMSLNSYWDSGYRDYFAIVPIDASAAGPAPVASIPQNGTQFDDRNLSLSDLPAGFAVAVLHYAGKRTHGTLHLSADNVTPMLAAPIDSPWIETAVLAIVCSLKSFARRDQAQRLGIGPAEYDATIAVLKAKRLLTAAGGASPDGRNQDNAQRGPAIQWNWGTLAIAGGRDCEEKRTADRMAEYARSVQLTA